ncbi:type I glyceraldehyde-3-phosphate dehydrogenase [Candidatus Uhrbacteria bacterium]|nr:type I glyceraldehyde-3-phosphate dehydrogenase [Candidatus Uhrbacteria bacterium]
MPRIAINGFGRIGRNTFKAGFGKKGFDVVAINDLADAEMLAALLQNDTVFRRYEKSVSARKGMLVVDGVKIPVFSQKDPAQLPWKKLRVDTVLECTGHFTSEEGATLHVKAGAKRVIISAPAKGGIVPTYVRGVNDANLKKEKRAIINNASCTTNCTSPVLAVMEEAFGVKKAMLSTIHAYTSTQNLQDGPHKDMRRARAAAANIIPTSTGAARAATEAMPSLRGKFDGMAFRVPVLDGSVTDFVFLLKRKVTVEDVNRAFAKAAKTPRFKGILEVTDAPLVSSDIIGNAASAIVNTDLTMVVDGDLVKVVAWYDNEWGYSSRLAEMAMRW